MRTFLILFFALSACSKPDPLVGVWEHCVKENFVHQSLDSGINIPPVEGNDTYTISVDKYLYSLQTYRWYSMDESNTLEYSIEKLADNKYLILTDPTDMEENLEVETIFLSKNELRMVFNEDPDTLDFYRKK
ncbi:MAG: hypothetical protein R8P61_00680 [Bacteroidia bacterium]|nr:hypothetical protein [Bacteroidia bacterium]